jgi:4'-phosphopantetheinyl transferase
LVGAARDLPPDRDWLSAAEATRLAGMAFAKRRAEFLLRRWTAKQAIAAVAGVGTNRIEVANQPSGAPFALVDGTPCGYAISLTDRSGWAVCAIAEGSAPIGCDLELVEPRGDGFVRDFFTEAEQRVVAAAGGDDRWLAATLLWSAKESALKVLGVGLRHDTRTVEIEAGDGTGGEWAPFVARVTDHGELPGWWRRYREFTLTVAATGPFPPPTPLAR